MNIIVGDLLTFEGKKYIVLSVLFYQDKKYYFTNLVKDNEDLTGEYYIFTLNNYNLDMVVDDQLREVLLPKFEMAIKNEINNLSSCIEN